MRGVSVETDSWVRKGSGAANGHGGGANVIGGGATGRAAI